MSKAQNGTGSIHAFKRFLIIMTLSFTAIAAVYPTLNRQLEVSEDQNIAKSVAVDINRWISYNRLMIELERRASKFHGEAGIYIKDLKTSQVISIQPSKLFPSASLVKVPIMAACYQAQQEGRLNLDDKLTLLRHQKIRSCSHLYFARSGSRFTIRDLIERMITESDNTATNMLTDHLGFAYLNQKFVEFGLRNTDLRRGVMDLQWRAAGIENYTTPEDMAFILEKIYRGELVSDQASGEMMGVLKRQKVNDRIPRWLPDDVVIAHKTGLLRDTVSDCGIVFTQKGDFIICVLTSEINNFKLAKRFIGRIAACAYDRCYRETLTQTAKSKA